MQRHDAIISRILITEVKMIIYSGQSGSSYDNLISYAYIVDNDIVYTIYARLVVLTVKNTIIRSMSDEDNCIDLNFYREQIKEFEQEYKDVSLWTKKDISFIRMYLVVTVMRLRNTRKECLITWTYLQRWCSLLLQH